MKKITFALIVFCMLFTGVYAKSGDIAGNVYSTDITAYINGVEVPSYNIGGKTAVIIEDICSYNYSDYYRTLKFFDLNPLGLKSGSSENSAKPGKIIGKIYETDIKTSIYNVELPSYNIGGKTAVAIEDLGKDGEFSEIGGKYVWDGTNRTISLEFMYETPCPDIVLENGAEIYIDISEDLSKGDVTITKNPLFKGSSSTHFNWPEGFEENKSSVIIPLFADGEQVGYHYYRVVEKDDYNKQGFIAFTYMYNDLLSKACENAPNPIITRDDVIEHYLANRLGTIKERFDTDDYSFLYINAGTSHGSTSYLLYVKEDGTYYDYSRDFKSVSFYGNITFDSVVIDREAEKVYIHYDVDYVLDLKSGLMTKE